MNNKFDVTNCDILIQIPNEMENLLKFLETTIEYRLKAKNKNVDLVEPIFVISESPRGNLEKFIVTNHLGSPDILLLVTAWVMEVRSGFLVNIFQKYLGKDENTADFGFTKRLTGMESSQAWKQDCLSLPVQISINELKLWTSSTMNLFFLKKEFSHWMILIPQNHCFHGGFYWMRNIQTF